MQTSDVVNILLLLCASGSIVWSTRALRRERDWTKAYFDVAGTMLVIIESSDVLREINHRGLELLGYDDATELVGRPWFDRIIPSDQKAVFGAALEQARSPCGCGVCETKVLRRDGTERLISWRLVAIRRAAKRRMIVAAGEDVTDQRRIDTELRDALNARELLFREADHRIKNSLQIVGSLLQMQQRRATDPEMVKALDAAIARVNSVAEVHLALQRSKDFRTVAFGHVLRDICARLGNLSPTVDVKCRYAGALYLDAERAIPLGLLVTELITKALRYAYRPGYSGLVTVDANHAENVLTVTIEDDGGESPLDVTDRELGSTIIGAMSAQIDARLVIASESGSGTLVTIQIPNLSLPDPDDA